MASACRQFARKASISSVRSAIRSNVLKSPTSHFPAAAAAPVRAFSVATRSTAMLQSLLPLHSAVADARLTSALSTTCRSLSQELGLSVPR